MSIRDAGKVLYEYIQPLQEAIHCVTAAKLWRGTAAPDVPHILTFANSPRIELKRRDSGNGDRFESVYLYVLIGYRIIQPPDAQPRVVTSSYQFAITNQHQREIMAFHWHPDGISNMHDPHIHIGSGIVNAAAGDLGKVFSSVHIPTGHLSLARVMRMLLTEFQVIPNLRDWQNVLDRLIADEE